ncbi:MULTISPECIES: signal recognition particle-docking protein FtsY [Halorussus]|uniref:signal recognition particle-docking protein FtsY n=1 Tax=Halorussus TaxID=1070314 RepID=UPI0020A1FCF4|nr:signal recognition particle-docking protein FtsY [Halorussus vallis]USZ73990.1 signal recognition particle-docking protein FtsY [Halorussus vallis]
MFDSLKDKLGSFRKNVEETTEEKAEEAEAEAEADAAAESGADAETEASADAAATDAETAGTTGSDTAETSDAAVATSSVEPATEPESEPEPETETQDEPETEPEPESDDASSDSESSGGSFMKKATSFAKGQIVIEEQDLEDPLWELEMALLESDVEMNVAKEILENIREDLIGATRSFSSETGDVVQEALADSLLQVISVGQFDFDERIRQADKPVTIIFTGVNGVGKTTSIAKLSRYFEEQGLSTVMANGDTYRAGANEQIQEHADNLGTKLITHEQGGDPAAVIYDAVEYAKSHDVDVVLGDTAGRLHTNEGLMDQLEKIGRVVDPDMTLFVDEAVAGQDAVQRAKQFNEAAEIDGAVLTKADADSQGGAAISIAHVTGKPILFLGVGQGYDDIQQFDPEALVDDLLADEE